MEAAATKLGIVALAGCLFALPVRPAAAQQPKVPDGPPPHELVGRWAEKTSDRKGNHVRYNFYLLSAHSEFTVTSLAFDEKKNTWRDAKKIWPKGQAQFSGYFEATAPDRLTFNALVGLAQAVLPFETTYKVDGDTLQLGSNPFARKSSGTIRCKRVTQLPGESAADAAEIAQKIEEGFGGPEFRRLFERAVHEIKPHPTDEEMIATFREHRAEFEQLRAMMQQDEGLARVDDDWTQPEDPASIGVPPERIAEYRSLAKKLALERGVAGFGDKAQRIDFIASARGLSISGSSKSFVWLGTPPQPTEDTAIVENLDNHVRQKQAERSAYFDKHKRRMSGNIRALREIEPHWYLEYAE
jgi:hypothetical protein